MSRETEIRKYLNVIKRAVALIEAQLGDDAGLLEEIVAGPPSRPTPVLPEPAPAAVEPAIDPEHHKARAKHIDDLLAIDCWPEALPSFLAAQQPSDHDQAMRANAVLDMTLDRSVEGLKFLDFGCGDGWIASQVLSRGVAESWGHDIAISPRWEKVKGPKFTNKASDLPHDYFDIVMLYDVLDHCDSPTEVMERVRSSVKEGGTVYARCHPWTSRHATHIFKKGVNKAYWHLFLTPVEIGQRWGPQMFTRMERKPIDAYHFWFSGFHIKKEIFIKEPVSDFFHVPAFKDLLASEQQLSGSEIDEFMSLMEVQFVDYVLTPKRR